jgi:hypoxanthine-DNA glycosylase
MIKKRLPPIIDKRAKVLVFGEYSSDYSRMMGMYYAHKQNKFWNILGDIIQKPLHEMDYQSRIAAIKEERIVIWDVYEFRDFGRAIHKANDFGLLRKMAPELKIIIFNGNGAGLFEPIFTSLGYQTMTLPSTSPANNTISFAKKLALWRKAIVDLSSPT